MQYLEENFPQILPESSVLYSVTVLFMFVCLFFTSSLSLVIVCREILQFEPPRKPIIGTEPGK